MIRIYVICWLFMSSLTLSNTQKYIEVKLCKTIIEKHIAGKASMHFSWRFVDLCSFVIWFGAGLAVQLLHELSDKTFYPGSLAG